MGGEKEKAAKHPCLHCKVNIGQEKAIQCTLCDYWVHPKCAKIDDDLYKNLVAISEKGFKHCWTCMCCTKSVENLNKKVIALEKRITEVDNKVDVNTEAIEVVNSKVDNLTKVVDGIKESVKGDVISANAQDNVFKEIQERESRKENLVVHGLPEPADTVKPAAARKEKDIENLSTVLQDIKCTLDFKEDVKFLIRAGERKEGVDYTSKPRPLLLGLRNLQKKELILNSARNLPNTVHENISIVPDLTKRQRKEEETMRAEAKKLNEEMSSEDSLNYVWMVVGRRGQRKLARLRRRDKDGNSSSQTRTNSAQNRMNMNQTMTTRKRDRQARGESSDEAAAARDPKRS